MGGYGELTVFTVQPHDELALQAVLVFINFFAFDRRFAFNDRQFTPFHQFLDGSMFQNG